MQWLIIDTTPRSQVSLPAEGHTGLQSLVSDSMALPLDFVQSVWVPVSLTQARRATFPGEAQECASVIVDRELEQVQLYLRQQGMSLDGMQTLILTDEIESSPSVVGRFVVRLCSLTKREPETVGVQQNGLMQWVAMDEPIIRQIAHRIATSYMEEA